jgi:NTP pyrophosphatase (non-canonical NTP hydrolase)
MHEHFVKYGTPPVKLIEECSELIQAVCKGERFGYDDFNPLIPNAKTTRENIRDEIADVHYAMTVFEQWLNALPPDIKRRPEDQ